VHKFIYNYSKSIVRNTVDYSGQEKFFLEKHLCADRPASGADRPVVVKPEKNPKVTGSVKFIFSVLVDHPGCTAGPSVTALSDI
jgi:hypothetical protein